jgi:iron complex transport system ATP-binding protein
MSRLGGGPSGGTNSLDQREETAAPVVDVNDLSVAFGATQVLDSVSLSVGRGEFVGLVGPNGAGKTTLLRAMRATLVPDSGRVVVCGEDVHSLSSRAASRLVASVPQETTLSFEFTVLETVEMGRTPHLSRFGRMGRADHDAIEEAMARTDVCEFADRPVSAVSGGERSRVVLARALAQETPVLLLDEPTANLDVNHQVRTLDLVADLTDEGRTAVAAIHDLGLAARYCDRLVVVADGGILASGSPEAVLSTDSLRAAFDAESVVTTDPVTESPRVTTLSGRRQGRGDVTFDALDRIHVVAGGGRSGSLLATLGRTDLTVSVGPVATGDSDADVAEALGMETLTVGPLAGVDGRDRDRLGELLAGADAVVVGHVSLTAGLRPVLREVRRAGTPVVCVVDEALADRLTQERPLPEHADSDRHGDSQAVELYRDLASDGLVVAPASLLAALGSWLPSALPSEVSSDAVEKSSVTPPSE